MTGWKPPHGNVQIFENSHDPWTGSSHLRGQGNAAEAVEIGIDLQSFEPVRPTFRPQVQVG